MSLDICFNLTVPTSTVGRFESAGISKFQSNQGCCKTFSIVMRFEGFFSSIPEIRSSNSSLIKFESNFSFDA